MSDDQCGSTRRIGSTVHTCYLPAEHEQSHTNGIETWAILEPRDGGDMCRATTSTGFAVAMCSLQSGHDGQHDDGTYHWPNTAEEGRCESVGGWAGSPLARCVFAASHADDHSDGVRVWPNVQSLQERGPERPVQWCGNGSAPVGGPCSMTLGHEGDHQNGQHIWHQAQGNYRSTNLAGAKWDDLILDLFRRVEQLEQLARPTASCASEELRQGLGEVEKRMTRLEQAQVYGPGPHDLSGLHASIANHINRALTEFGSQLGIILDGMRDVLSEHISTNTTAVLARLAPVEPVPLRVVCAAPDNTGTLHCEKGPDHGGRHQSGNTSWPNPCRQPHPTLDVTCSTVKGHTTDHLAAYDPRYGRVRWVDDQEQYRDLGTVKDDGAATQALCGAAHPVESDRTCIRPEGHTAAHKSSSRGSVRLVWNDEPAPAQNERASGSPAAVRCPAQFREGQCLGYAGHDGECSAVPGSGSPQLEDPEEFDECGKDPAPGHAMPPCGRPAGHSGVCASGPQYSGEDEPGEPFAESTYDRTSDGTPIEPGDPFEGDGHGDTSHCV